MRQVITAYLWWNLSGLPLCKSSAWQQGQIAPPWLSSPSKRSCWPRGRMWRGHSLPKQEPPGRNHIDSSQTTNAAPPGSLLPISPSWGSNCPPVAPDSLRCQPPYQASNILMSFALEISVWEASGSHRYVMSSLEIPLSVPQVLSGTPGRYTPGRGKVRWESDNDVLIRAPLCAVVVGRGRFNSI